VEIELDICPLDITLLTDILVVTKRSVIGMNVVKRSEYCGTKGQLLKDIPMGTIFRGAIGGYPPHVWVKTHSINGNAICIGEADAPMDVGRGCSVFGDCGTVVGYEVLNATLVIDD